MSNHWVSVLQRCSTACVSEGRRGGGLKGAEVGGVVGEGKRRGLRRVLDEEGEKHGSDLKLLVGPGTQNPSNLNP